MVDFKTSQVNLLSAPLSPSLQRVKLGDLTVVRIETGLIDCELWCIRPDDVSGYLSTISKPCDTLSKLEMDRFDRFRFSKDKTAYLTKRLLIRNILSEYEDVSPRQWVFTINKFGCPSIAAEHKIPNLDFSLSQASGFTVCAVSRCGPIGIDVEDSFGPDISKLCNHILAREEHESLRQLSLSEQNFALLRYWTLKEAYTKCLGIGLNLPFKDICFNFQDPQSIRVSSPLHLLGENQSWRFDQFLLSQRYVVAVARLASLK